MFLARTTVSVIADEYDIGQEAMEIIYMSPNPHCDSFDELLDIHCFDFSRHDTAGLLLIERDGRVNLAHMVQGTPRVKIPCWRTRICGAWLTKIGNISSNISLMLAKPCSRPLGQPQTRRQAR